MSTVCAVVENGVVTNTVIANSDDSGTVPIPEGLPVTIGWLYDGTTFTPPPPPPPKYNSYTVATFIEALTRDEALNFLATMKTDPLLEMWYELAKARNGVDFNDEATRTNAAYLVQAGILTQDRLDALIG